jgi:hypothetical protein
MGQRLHRRNTMHEKPWYTPAIISFIRDDVPRILEISPGAVARDITTLERRLTFEGESFLTKTLPALGKSIDLALQGHTPLATNAFQKVRRSSALPAFLQALLKRVFSDKGWVLENPCIESIRLLRQVCFWCKKIEKGFTDESLQIAIDDFKTVDGGLPTDENDFVCGTLGTAKALVEHILGEFPGCDRLRPAHGPGAVANGEDVIGKRLARHAFHDLESVFRPIPYFFSLRDAAENPSIVTGRIHCEYGLSRTQFVEKDSSGPRTIGLEPAEYMWCQQALKGFLYNHIESHPLTSGQVNFTNQDINRNLTSRWPDYDTLDMSKASDRNSLALVKSLFKDTWIWPYMLACRTPGTVLPSGELLWFKKFAPMGSAMCFPTMALVFYTLAVATLHKAGVPLLIAARNVFVYGDDLVVPHGYFAHLKSEFEGYSLKFNESKCCVHGKFRESCGMDAYDGHEVTPVRMRKVYPDGSPASFIPIIKHCNNLYASGYWSSSQSLRKTALERFSVLRRLKIPYSPKDDLPILYWRTSSVPETVTYLYKHSIYWVKGWSYTAKKRCTCGEGEASFLLESLALRGPVGNLRVSESCWMREFSKKYDGKLIKGMYSVPIGKIPVA